MAVKKEPPSPAGPAPPPSAFVQSARRKLPEPKPMLAVKVNLTQGEIQRAAPSVASQGGVIHWKPFIKSKLIRLESHHIKAPILPSRVKCGRY